MYGITWLICRRTKNHGQARWWDAHPSGMLGLGQPVFTQGPNLLCHSMPVSMDMGVSWNVGTAKWSVYIWHSYSNGWFRGTPILGTPISDDILIKISRLNRFDAPFITVLSEVFHEFHVFEVHHWFPSLLLKTSHVNLLGLGVELLVRDHVSDDHGPLDHLFGSGVWVSLLKERVFFSVHSIQIDMYIYIYV